MLKNKTIIGPWQIDPDANEISADDNKQRLTPKAMQLLMVLIESDGEVVTRAGLMDQVGLSDEGVSRLINEIREALGDQARAPRFIETIPRRGYRLIGRVNETASTAQSTWRRVWLPAAIVLMLAVLAGLSLIVIRSDPSSQYQLSRVVRLTPTEGRAILPHLEDGTVQFLSLDEGDDRSRMRQVSLDTLVISDVHSEAGTVQLLNSSSGPIRMRQTEQGCQLQFPNDQALPCRKGSGGLALHRESNRLAFEHPGAGLGVVELTNGRVSLLTSPPEGMQDSEPAWSDDGQLAFIRGDEVRSEVYLIASDGDRARAISEDHQAIFDLAWLSNDHLLVASDRTGTRRLWALDRRSDDWTDLHQPDVWRISVQSPNVIFERPVFRADILRWDGQSSTPVVNSARFDNHPAISPDGRRLAFVSMRSGVPSLWFSDIDGKDASLLHSPGGGRITRPVWQDNDHLTFLEYSDANVRLRSISLSRELNEINLSGLNVREAAYDGSGQLFLIGDHDGRSGLFRLADQGPELLLAGDFQRLVANADHLFVGDRDRGRIRLFDMIEGPRDLVSIDSLHWTASGSQLYFLRDGAVHAYRIDSGEERVLSAPPPSTIGLGLAVNPVTGDLFSAIYSGHMAALYHLQITVDE